MDEFIVGDACMRSLTAPEFMALNPEQMDAREKEWKRIKRVRQAHARRKKKRMQYHVTKLVTRNGTPDNPPCEVWRDTLKGCAEYMRDFARSLEKLGYTIEVGEGTVTATQDRGEVIYLECRALDMLERYLWDEMIVAD